MTDMICATEGCGRRGRHYFERGDIGANYCDSCIETIRQLAKKRDVFEVANQLGGYIGPDTEKWLAAFLRRESTEAGKLANEIVALRAKLDTAVKALERARDVMEHTGYRTTEIKNEIKRIDADLAAIKGGE